MVSIVLSHMFVIIVRWIKISEHRQGLHLWPASPSGDHSNCPVLDPDPVLTASTAEWMRAIECPRFVIECLQVGRECTAEHARCLWVEDYESLSMASINCYRHTIGSDDTAPCLLTFKNKGPCFLIFLPYKRASMIIARIGHNFVSSSFANSFQVWELVCEDLRTVSLTSINVPTVEAVRVIIA